MIPEGKKATLMVLNPVDRLSDLPDSVIHHVISFLGTKEAARTTILSKRWSSIWSTSPVLDFQPHYFFKEENTDSDVVMSVIEQLQEWIETDGYTKYLRFIDITLDRYAWNNMSLRKLTMEFPKVDRCVTSRLDKWLAIAVQNQVEELSISFTDKSFAKYRLPAIVFSAKFLKKLSCCRVEVPNYEPKRLICLQYLSLNDATVEEDVVQHMINSCPLNTLLLRKCFGLKTILIPHFSKIETIEFWRSVKTGGTIKVESSCLVDLSCFSWGNVGDDFSPMKIHGGLSNLRNLTLDLSITDEMLVKLLSGLALETLTLCGSTLPDNICIYGTRLKELSLDGCYGLTNVTIDTPNLDMLVYTGKLNILFFATNIPLKCKVYFNIVAEGCDTDWFIDLKNFLSQSRIFQFLNVWMSEDPSMCEFSEDKPRKIPHIPPYKLREMRVSLPSSVSKLSSLSAFIDGLFWSCLPDQLCIAVTSCSEYMVFESFMKLMRKKVKCWSHPLKRIEGASTDCSNLPGCLEVEFYFKLYW